MKPIGLEKEGTSNKQKVDSIYEEPIDIAFSKVQIEDIYEDVDFDTFSKSDFRAVKVKAVKRFLKA